MFYRNRFSKVVKFLLPLVFGMLPVVSRADSVIVLFALEADLKTLREGGTEIGEPRPWLGGKLYTVQVGSHQIKATLMQSGSLESAITAASLLGREKPDWLLTVGVAGSLSNTHARGSWLNIGELVLNSALQPSGTQSMIKLSTPSDWSGVGAALPLGWDTAASVRLLTVGGFLKDTSERDGLRSETGADIVDMNLIGIVRACQRSEVKNLHWRIVSDWANEDAGRDFRSFVEKYDGAGGRLVVKFLKKLPISPDRPEAYSELSSLLKNVPQ